MKRVKFLLPMLALLFAIAGAFATHYSSFTILTPDKRDVSCLDCFAPLGEDDQGEVYDATPDAAGEYNCTTVQGDDRPRCRCFFEDEGIQWDDASNIAVACVPLYKLYFGEPE